MATTRFISMHQSKGKTIAQCLSERTNYAKNKDKTMGGELVSSYGCDARTVDAEFAYAKRQYKTITGREPPGNVIAYQIRQSFRPGEVTPEEANRIGYELAERFLKGKHAYIVATHCDKAHIHNHIIFNSTSLDCTGKFRDFLGSGKAVARLSDIICLEHGLSIIENPKRGSTSYNKWLGDKAKPSQRELLCAAIDEALRHKPKDFDAFLQLMAEAGYAAKKGKHLAFLGQEGKKSIRLRSLGEGYSEAELRSAILGEKAHEPRKKQYRHAPTARNLLIDINAKIEEGKGYGYQRWAKVHNLKQMAQTVNYLREHNLLDYDELLSKIGKASETYHTLSSQIKAAEGRMAEVAVLKTHIINYVKTRDVYAEYRKAGYSKKYLAQHEGDILLHKAAKKAFDEQGLKKLPTVKSLQEEYSTLLAVKKQDYSKYRAARDEMRELLSHRVVVDDLLGKKEERIDRGPDSKEKQSTER